MAMAAVLACALMGGAGARPWQADWRGDPRQRPDRRAVCALAHRRRRCCRARVHRPRM